MGKEVLAARVSCLEKERFEHRVAMMKPIRTVSARIRQLIIQDIKKGNK